MDIESLNTQFSIPVQIAGVTIAAVGLVWLYVLAARAWGWWLLFPPTVAAFPLAKPDRSIKPLLAMALGLGLIGVPMAISRLTPIDLGERDKMVNGERHITLTGWDRSDYALLDERSDATVLQMANSDVSDETLKKLRTFSKLRKLDLGHSQVTDAGIVTIADLPLIEELFLDDTRVTDAGISALVDHPTLKRLKVKGTTVTAEGARKWQSARDGRRVIR